MNVKYRPNKELDAAIVKLYQARPERGAVARFAKRLGYPAEWISKRALILGVRETRCVTPPWSQAELAILRDYHWRDIGTIQRQLRSAGFMRRAADISTMRKRRVDDTYEQTYITPGALARLCGVDKTTVWAWLEHDELRCVARTRGTGDRRPGEHRYIAIDDLRAWLCEFAHRIDLRKVDQRWFWSVIALPPIRAQQAARARPAASTTERMSAPERTAA